MEDAMVAPPEMVTPLKEPRDRFDRLNAESPAGVASPALPIRGASLATILAGHVLQDGELILMILKPSMWFIVISSLGFAAVVAIFLIAALIFTNPNPTQWFAYVETTALIIAGRLMWAMLQWMGRFYILTDMRIVRLGGVFTIELFACPLRKVARTRVVCTTRERLCRLGSIEIVPGDAAMGWGTWQTVTNPEMVHDQVTAAIDRAKQGML